MSSEITPSTQQTPLVRHTARKEWGRALFLWHREDKRAYQFEDGRMRVFADSYKDMLRPAAKPDPVVRHKLRRRAVAEGHIAPLTDGAAPQTPTLEDQVVVFEELFEDGFHGNAWTDAVRERPGKRPLKRHRDPVIRAAQERLTLDRLRMLVEGGKPTEAIDEILDVIASSDLATRQQLTTVRALSADVALAHAWIDYIHGMSGLRVGPLDQLRLELARKGLRQVPWTVVTAARALVHPSEHAYIRPSVFRAQLRLSAPNIKLSTAPTPEVYARCLEVALEVHTELRDRGFRPRDLFDVAAFMRVTTSRKYKSLLDAAMLERLGEENASDTEVSVH